MNRRGLLAASSVEFIIPAVKYVAVSDYLDPTGVSTPKIGGDPRGLISFWFRRDGNGDAGNLYVIEAFLPGPVLTFRILIKSDDKFHIQWGDFTTPDTEYRSTTTYAISATWHHFMASWDGGLGAKHMYIDGVDVLDVVVDVAVTPFGIDHIFNTGGFFPMSWDGGMAQFYMTDEYLDLSIATNRDKLYDSVNNKVVNFGTNGSLVTGTQPLVYLNNDAANIGTNLGSAQDMTVIGSPTDTTPPP